MNFKCTLSWDGASVQIAFPPAVRSVTLEGEEIVNGALTGKR